MTAPSRTEQPTLHDVLGAPLPPAPAYGSNSIADVLEYWRDQVRTGATDPTPLEMRIVTRR